jgi:acyl-CoA thioesterase
MADTRKTAVYDITITNQHKIMVASFRGTVYKLDKKVVDL